MDSKWLEILKASGWQTLALTIAFGLFIYLVNKGVIPTNNDPLWIALPTLGFLICGFLALARIGSAIDPATHIRIWRHKKRTRDKLKKFIPFMTEKDKEIIGYLLRHNQKVFTYDDTGGYAGSLISKGFIRVVTSPYYNQAFDNFGVTFEIPDHLWEVLETHRDKFPYSPSPNNETEPYPWAIPWMAR